MSPVTAVPRFTLDTGCVIAGIVQTDPHHDTVEGLVDLARAAQVELWLTTAFDMDQSRAHEEQRQTAIQWLYASPVLSAVSGPFRIGYSTLGGGDVLVTGEDSVTDRLILETVWPQGHTGLAGVQGELSRSQHRRVIDAHHLHAHLLAGHDVFVTTDEHDILRRRDALRATTGIMVMSPREAIHHLVTE